MPPARQPQPLTVAQAAKGSRMDLLVAMRDLVARELDGGVPARDLASLMKRLLDITKEIEALNAATNGDTVGQAAALPDAAWSAG